MKKFNICSYNILHGAYSKFDFSLIGNDIKSKDIQFAGIQEVDMFSDRTGNLNSMKLLSDYSDLPYNAFFKGINVKGGEYGIGILSKYPIIETERYEYECKDFEQRVIGRCLVNADGMKINFFVTHLSYEDKEIRLGQMKKLTEIADKYENVIITGDFNTDTVSEFAAFEEKGYKCVNNENENLITFPPDLCIDNIICKKSEFKLGTPKTVENNHSDHYMLYTQAQVTE